MNKEDIIRMAREAGCIPRRHPEYDNDVQVFATPDVLERFAHLVAAAEREACAKVCEHLMASRHLSRDEATVWVSATLDCADAIQARGQT